MRNFDLRLAKTPSNESGFEVCNRKGEEMVIMKVSTSPQVLYPIIAKRKGTHDDTCMCYMMDGKWDEKESDNDLMLR